MKQKIVGTYRLGGQMVQALNGVGEVCNPPLKSELEELPFQRISVADMAPRKRIIFSDLEG